MKEAIIQRLIEYCNDGHTPLTLQNLLKENAPSLKLTDDQVKWLKKYIHRVRDIIRSEPGHQTLYAFKDGETHTSYSLKKRYKKNSHASYADWLVKLEEIKLLCRYDQENDLEKWRKKKEYGINPDYLEVTKIILEVIRRKYHTPSI